MIINQNLAALNTFNSLNKNTAATAKSIQKLSTGHRINGASDDAAGLAISEKMRGQISGLKQSSSNAQDGISMLQTAEGGLDQTHSILQRMRQLAVQSSSDTNTADDRKKIQGEVDQLAKEITRISNTTEFNTQNLLAGGLSDTFHIGANAGQNLSVSVGAMDAQSLGVASHVAIANTVTANGSGLNITSVARGLAASTGYSIVVGKSSALATTITTTSQADTTNPSTLKITGADSFTGTADTNYLVKVASVTNTANGNDVNSISYSKDNGVSWNTVNGDLKADAGIKIDGMTVQLDTSKVTKTTGGTPAVAATPGTPAVAATATTPAQPATPATAGSPGTPGTSTTVAGKYTVGDQYSFSTKATFTNMQLKLDGVNVGASVNVHKGDSVASVGDTLTGQTVNVQFDYNKLAAASATLGVKHTDSTSASVNQGEVTSQATVTAGIDISTQKNANDAITTIDKAINTVSQQRSQIGAYQNRLTNTIDNLNTSNENITASESRIRDVDMASEMSNYQKNNILQSAATSMLAKANQQPQSVLQLLQG